MITLFHFLRLAVQNLRRGGQRVLVALLCITFGVMALVAMSMIARCISSAVEMTPAQLVGGDISMGRKSEDTILPAQVDQLNALQQSGAISRYTLIAFSSAIMFHTSGSGEMHFVGNGLGVEPDRYPLAGSLTIGEPGSTGLPTLLQQPGDAVVTRDLAEQFHLKVGDPIFLADQRIGVPVAGTVRGIAFDTPNHQGDKIYYSIATAQKMANGQPVVNTVIVNAPDAQAISDRLDQAGWSVDWTAGRRNMQTANAWMMGLRGAGLLGLLVSGIGIANTMQVLLRRRQREIAIWKTLGYRSGDLRLIFSLEAGLLGLAGSLFGSALGVLISTGLLTLFRSTSTLLYQWTFSPTPPLMGVLAGTLTTVIFAHWAIVISSQASPLALLRNERIDPSGQRLTGCQSAVLGLLLAVLFIGLAILAMESLPGGIGMLAAIGLGLAILGGFFSGLLWVCSRILPLRGLPLVGLALNSLRRRGAALVFAMIALFVGILSMSMGLAVTQKNRSDLPGPAADLHSYNLNILAAADQESAVRQAIQALNPEKVAVGYRTTLAGLSAVGGEGKVPATEAALVGRSDPQDYVLSGAAWGSQPEGVYADKFANLKAGSQVKVTLQDGTSKTLTVVGSYDVNHRSNNLYPPTGLLMTAEGFKLVARPDALTFFVRVAPGQLDCASADLGAALPQATVVNLVAYAARFMRSYQNLYLLPMALASLALLAGFLLVANSVSLAMLDRRYEIGILKTVGYSRGQILAIFAVEYGLVGLLSTGAGVLVVQGMLAALALAEHMAVGLVLLSIPSLALIAFCGVFLTLLVVCGVTWDPTRVSPVVVLNERN